MLRMLLEAHGYQVETAGDGEEGAALILEKRPTLRLVDIGLPKLDGYEVAKRGARADRRHAHGGADRLRPTAGSRARDRRPASTSTWSSRSTFASLCRRGGVAGDPHLRSIARCRVRNWPHAVEEIAAAVERAVRLDEIERAIADVARGTGTKSSKPQSRRMRARLESRRAEPQRCTSDWMSGGLPVIQAILSRPSDSMYSSQSIPAH